MVCVTADADKGCKLRPDVDKARFLFVAQIHARELTTSEMTWRTLALLTDGYGTNADLTALLDETEIWIIPQLNPDGIQQVERGFLGEDGDIWQRKNMHFEQDCGTGPTSHIGVDLNRNHDLDWGGAGSSDFPCDQTYRGLSAASEPETFHFQDLTKDLFEDQRGSDPEDVRGTLLTLHTYANQSLYPYDAGEAGQDVEALRSIAFRYSHYNAYSADQAGITGSTDLYSYNTSGIAAADVRDRPGQRDLLRLPPRVLLPGRLLGPEPRRVPVRRPPGPGAVCDGLGTEHAPGQVEDQERAAGRDQGDR